MEKHLNYGCSTLQYFFMKPCISLLPVIQQLFQKYYLEESVYRSPTKSDKSGQVVPLSYNQNYSKWRWEEYLPLRLTKSNLSTLI